MSTIIYLKYRLRIRGNYPWVMVKAGYKGLIGMVLITKDLLTPVSLN